MHQRALSIFISAALLGALTISINSDSAGGSREPLTCRSVIGGKDDQMKTVQVPRLVPPGLRLSDLAPGECFASRISGNSMEPDYRDGDAVIFNVVAAKDADSVLGRDCMFWRDDGQATFKRLSAIMDRDTLILDALNRKAFPEPLAVQRAELRMLAFARYVYREASSAGALPPAQKKSGTPGTSNAAQPTSKSSKRKALSTAA